LKEHPTKRIVVNGVIQPEKYTQHSVSIDTGSAIKTLNIGQQTGIRFQTAWGKDSANWIGKKFTIKFEPYMSFGKPKKGVAGYPITETKA
jgi:hypothetical protein